MQRALQGLERGGQASELQQRIAEAAQRIDRFGRVFQGLRVGETSLIEAEGFDGALPSRQGFGRFEHA